MVSSAVLGAAVGTGVALVIAITIMLYHYYVLRRRSKDWGDVERFQSPAPLSTAPPFVPSYTRSLPPSRRMSKELENKRCHGQGYVAKGRVRSSYPSRSPSRKTKRVKTDLKRWEENQSKRSSLSSQSSTQSCPPLYYGPRQLQFLGI